ncbi:MAG: Uma2 family endonuclease [Verrucomicrobiales bacterium]|nr:Uma2 family endonuclease [Verrucomicrobiales bacterium]
MRAELRMPAAAKTAEWITPEEYLEGELLSETRHEYVEGRIYAVAGASDDHNRIAINLGSELRERLRGHPCEPFVNDMKVKMPPQIADVFYYPDVLVAWDPTDSAKYFRERPVVIFEVLSPETERTDVREKAIAYRQIPTVKVYALLEQDRMAVTILRQAEQGWRKEIIEGQRATLSLPEIGLEIPLARIYERTSAAAQEQDRPA